MSMPQDLVLVRHGESEGNVVQRAYKHGELTELPSNFLDTHDWHYHLTPEGVAQAQAAGRWLTAQFGEIAESFDEHYVSPYIRTRETAAHLGGSACAWLVDERLRERDWGVYNSVEPDERKKFFPHTERVRKQTSLRWRPDGGESLMSEVMLRYRDWLDTLNREQSDKRVLAVSHGELMWVARYVHERMLPEEWEAADEDRSQRLVNTAILWYSRRNPENPDHVDPHIRWRKIVCPFDDSLSPFNGEWVELESTGKRRLSGAQLLETTERVPRMTPFQA